MIWRTLVGTLTVSLFPAYAGWTGAALSFEPIGREGPASRFHCRAAGHSAVLTADAAVLHADGSTVVMRLLGANPAAPAEGLQRQEFSTNYLVGSNPLAWRVNVPTFSGVLFQDVYPGINVIYHGVDGRLVYDFEVSPGADPGQIRIRFEGVEQVRTESDGDLMVRTRHGEFRQTNIHMYQAHHRGRRKVAGRMAAFGGGEVGFVVAEYDRSEPLTIDPTIVYSSYLGGSGNDVATAVSLDPAGNLYVAGWTESTDFFGTPAPGGGLGKSVDAFVAKFNPAGTLIYLVYLGGRGDDRAYGVAVDASGSAMICGSTYSLDFPTKDAFQVRNGGGRDGFIARLNSSGTALVFSTYLGGGGSDSANGLAMDHQGAAYVAGETTSANFPTTGAVQNQNAGSQDAFIAKFSSAGVRQYATYVGGLYEDFATAVTVDAAGNAHITGGTYSPNFPVVHALQPKSAGGQDGFVAKLNASGTNWLYSTYLGGSGGRLGAPEYGASIAVDSAGFAYVAGNTNSSNFPTTSPLQSSTAGSQDIFLAKLAASGSALVYSTYVGGSGIDSASAIAVDSSGAAHVVGYTASTDFPRTGSLQSSNAGSYDAVILKVSPAGNILQMATYFGGNASDSANAVAVSSGGNIHLAGQTQSTDLPMVAAAQWNRPAAMSAFVARVSLTSMPGAVSVSPATWTGNTGTFTFTVSSETGYRDLAALEVVINSGVSAGRACYFRYEPLANRLWLVNDEGTQFVGPATPGVSGSLSNSQCTIDVGSLVASGSGNTLVLNARLTFAGAFGGARGVYLWAMSMAGLSSGYQQRAAWIISGDAPEASSTQPSTGAGLSATFQFVVSDSAGYRDVAAIEVIFHSGVSAANACYVRYEPSANQLWLVNNAGTQFVGPASPGVAGTLSNSQCTVDLGSSGATGNGNLLTLSVRLTFTAAFAGPKNIYLWAASWSGRNSGYQLRGSWIVSGPAVPGADSVQPSSGSGASGLFQFIVSDSGDYRNLAAMEIVFNSGLSGAHACYLRYEHLVNRLWLVNDEGTQFMGPATPGATGTLSNSQCSIDPRSVAVAGSGKTLSLTASLTFTAAFAGSKTVYLWALSTSAQSSGYQHRGVWMVP